jgi:hypothetical protein
MAKSKKQPADLENADGNHQSGNLSTVKDQDQLKSRNDAWEEKRDVQLDDRDESPDNTRPKGMDA